MMLERIAGCFLFVAGSLLSSELFAVILAFAAGFALALALTLLV